MEANEYNFSISLEGDVTGQLWTGDFTSKRRLSHRDQLRKDAIRRDLLGATPSAPTEFAASIAQVLSEIRVRLIKAPVWWTDRAEGLDLEDDNLIGKIYDEVLKPQREADEARVKKAEAAAAEIKKSLTEKDKKDAELAEAAKQAAQAQTK